jgi:hypothetical protein
MALECLPHDIGIAESGDMRDGSSRRSLPSSSRRTASTRSRST